MSLMNLSYIKFEDISILDVTFHKVVSIIFVIYIGEKAYFCLTINKSSFLSHEFMILVNWLDSLFVCIIICLI